MIELKVAKNQSTGLKHHIMKKDAESGEWKSICGSIEKEPFTDFKGLEKKPPHGKWCGVCRNVFKSKSFRSFRTRGRLTP